MSERNHMSRRSLLIAGTALAVAPMFGMAKARKSVDPKFPPGFLWGAATAGHQIEGNNTASDLWLLEHVTPSAFAEPSGDAVNSLELWPEDLDIVRDIGLNTYRFSIEWPRIEPEQGFYSLAMLDHYRRMVHGCRERGLTPVVTFNHFTTPRWFAQMGGWTNAGAIALFTRYCERAARHLGDGIAYALTFNEPELMPLLRWIGLPDQVWDGMRANLAAAARAVNAEKFSAANVVDSRDIPAIQATLLAAHKAGREAIKSVRPDLPVGATLAVEDDQAVGSPVKRDAKRAEVYAAWLEAARNDDFVGVQNYVRARLDANGPMPPPRDAVLDQMGREVYPPSLGHAVRYVYEQAQVPVLVTEHGIATEDDALRARFVREALAGLEAAMADGVPVKGYIHWTLLDNFEWVFGYGPKLGLVAVDRTTFKRTPKPSAAVLGAIARQNSL